MTAEAPVQTARRSAVAMYTLLSVMFINILGFGIVVPLLPFYGASFHAPPWQIALIFSAYSLGSFVGEPFWGRLSDRVGRKPILVFTVLGNCACYGALAFAPDIWSAFAIRLVGGMAAGNGSVVQGYIADVTPPQELAGRMARLGASYNVGFILGPFVGGVLAKPSAGPLGFQIPLLAASALAACSALGIALAVRESRQRRPVETNPVSPWQAVGAVARHPVIGPLVLLTFLVGLAFNGIESVFALWAHHRFAWQPVQVGLLFGLSGLIASPTQFLLTGVLSRRYGEARMLAAGMAGSVIALALMPFVGGGWGVYALMAASALASSVAFPNAGALISRAVDDRNQGQIMGLNNATSAISRVIGPQAASLAFAFAGADSPFFLGAILTVPAIFLALRAGRAATTSA
ncbi:MAG TPA: MFS transporter [Caulobacteraceae bacterium]|jgi:MFS family permease|nr:MFS transporter [Caulobacteraceae bacterium]